MNICYVNGGYTNPHLSQDCQPCCQRLAGQRQPRTQSQSTWNQPEALKQYVSYWEVLDVRMYTPVLFAAQMELGWIRGITTCPSMNPYLQKKHQRSSTHKAISRDFITSHRMTFHAAQYFLQFTPGMLQGFDN